eukprot:scaffold32520_cov108-Isochrysis_galbana.AAC.2
MAHSHDSARARQRDNSETTSVSEHGQQGAGGQLGTSQRGQLGARRWRACGSLWGWALRSAQSAVPLQFVVYWHCSREKMVQGVCGVWYMTRYTTTSLTTIFLTSPSASCPKVQGHPARPSPAPAQLQ